MRRTTYIITLLFSLLILTAYSCDEEENASLVLSASELTLSVGETATLSIVEAPSISESVVWSSDNETVASVFFGEVTALNSGTAIITVQMGDYTATCEITVPERNYELVWSDEFDGTELNADNWSIEVNGNGGGNNEKQYYTDRSDNLRIEDGMLVIEAKKESYESKEYTSARIKTADLQEFAYGKVEVRLKVPSGTGTWPAFWMLGNEGGWPDAGEIDIMEHVGYDPNTFHCALHTANKNGLNGQNFSSEQELDEAAANDFHIITMEWTEQETNGYDRIHIYVDGVKTTTFAETAQLQASGDWPFNKPFYFIINLAIGGNWGGADTSVFPTGIDDSIFDSQVLYQVDYVRVYQLQ